MEKVLTGVVNYFSKGAGNWMEENKSTISPPQIKTRSRAALGRNPATKSEPRKNVLDGRSSQGSKRTSTCKPTKHDKMSGRDQLTIPGRQRRAQPPADPASAVSEKVSGKRPRSSSTETKLQPVGPSSNNPTKSKTRKTYHAAFGAGIRGRRAPNEEDVSEVQDLAKAQKDLTPKMSTPDGAVCPTMGEPSADEPSRACFDSDILLGGCGPSALRGAIASVETVLGNFPQHEGGALAAESADARDWLTAALLNPRGKEASSMTLRSSLQDVVSFLASNIETTVTEGHNNSVLLIGSHGAGKTLAVERAMGIVSQKYNRDASDPLVGVVRLLGWAHSDERTAFREIARQLCRSFQLQFAKGASVGNNITFLRDVLSALAAAHKVAVFVLDGLDLFAKRSKQTLLYCLLDALQTSGAQAVVLGLTTRHDCLELLEKRVKSRFSHRTALVHPPRCAVATLTDKLDVGNSPGPSSPSGADCPGSNKLQEGSIDVLRYMLMLPAGFPHKDHASRHNAAVEAALAHASTLPALDAYVAARPCLHNLRNVALWIIQRSALAAGGVPTITAVSQACAAITAALDGGIERYIEGLSVLEVMVLVAAFRASDRRDGDAITFEMMLNEFTVYCSAGEHVDNYSKVAALKAFERIVGMGLLTVAGGARGAQSAQGTRLSHHMAVNLQVRKTELMAGLAAHGTCPTRLRDWAVREGGPVTTAAAMI